MTAIRTVGEIRSPRTRRLRVRRPGPPGPYALLPCLLLGLGAFSNLWQGETPDPWVGGIGLLVRAARWSRVPVRRVVSW
ncbi:hypothetical protein ACFYY2_23190 [Streptomyces sp. NPDC001822]|uniref:hypothetical protein n=1 Tax=Streptomyces sp. NPDC001822 TaxID=3364614 RepID=UPI0036968649